MQDYIHTRTWPNDYSIRSIIKLDNELTINFERSYSEKKQNTSDSMEIIHSRRNSKSQSEIRNATHNPPDN